MKDKDLAILFHNAYEQLAPLFGYETREDTKQFDEKSSNGQLMIAVCGEILRIFNDEKKVYSIIVEQLQQENERLKKEKQELIEWLKKNISTCEKEMYEHNLYDKESGQFNIWAFSKAKYMEILNKLEGKE